MGVTANATPSILTTQTPFTLTFSNGTMNVTPETNDQADSMDMEYSNFESISDFHIQHPAGMLSPSLSSSEQQPPIAEFSFEYPSAIFDQFDLDLAQMPSES